MNITQKISSLFLPFLCGLRYAHILGHQEPKNVSKTAKFYFFSHPARRATAARLRLGDAGPSFLWDIQQQTNWIPHLRFAACGMTKGVAKCVNPVALCERVERTILHKQNQIFILKSYLIGLTKKIVSSSRTRGSRVVRNSVHRQVFWIPAFTGMTAFFVVFFLSCPAQAASSCYWPEEVQAEQLLRLHSELMVIAVTCQTSSRGDPLVPAYTNFTRKNKTALISAESCMKAYYERIGEGQSLDRLDSLRTRLANEIGEQVAREKAPYFCGRIRDKVVRASLLPYAALQREVQLASARKATYKPLCPSHISVSRR